MVQIFDYTCIVDGCLYSKKIVRTTRADIIRHLLTHDYCLILELSVKFKIIKTKSERRKPLWLAEQLFQFCTNEVNE